MHATVCFDALIILRESRSLTAEWFCFSFRSSSVSFDFRLFFLVFLLFFSFTVFRRFAHFSNAYVYIYVYICMSNYNIIERWREMSVYNNTASVYTHTHTLIQATYMWAYMCTMMVQRIHRIAHTNTLNSSSTVISSHWLTDWLTDYISISLLLSLSL